MSDPTITDYPGTIPGKSQSQAAFDTNVDAFLNWLTATNVPEYKLLAIWIRARVLEVAATAMSGDLPSITGQAGKALAVNSASDAVEFVNVTAAGWAILDDATPLAQRATLGTPPIPTSANVVGRWTQANNVAGVEVILAPGGTWAYFLTIYNSSGAFVSSRSGVVAGGSSIYGPVAGFSAAGPIWRIA